MTSTRPPNLDENILDRLEELSIINIDCEEGDSPSYGTASLPTPEAPHVDFTLRTSPYQPPLQLWYGDDDGAEGMEPVKPPGAPMLRDMDSFTEGTGAGSFEDLPATATNEVGERIYSATAATLSLLPPADSPLAYIEKWRKNVLEDTQLPVKRRRSPSPEDERCIRRTRPRTRAISLPPSFKAFTQYIGFYTTRSEPEAPD